MTKAKTVLFLHDSQTQLRIQNFFENVTATQTLKILQKYENATLNQV